MGNGEQQRAEIEIVPEYLRDEDYSVTVAVLLHTRTTIVFSPEETEIGSIHQSD